jgi:NitT/TauT family transport system ATP-binding protein
MSPTVVELREVTKRFGADATVLEGISFSARAGDFISIIGPSGCGKSTLLRLIAGLTPVSQGNVMVDGTTPEAAATRLAFVFQEPTLLPWLTVAENIELPERLRGVPPRERSQNRHRILERVRLPEKAGAYPRQLSGGQKMRVSLARALARLPKILLLDEPFGALDEMTREHLNEELLALREHENWTAFFVTHSVMEAVFLSNRVIVLASNPGRVHAEIAIPLPYPRTGETRLAGEFLDLVREVSRVLRSIDPNTTP